MNTRATELANKYELINLVLPFGFSPFIPEYDDGIDFILHRERDNVHLNVQLKSRWFVDRKYFGRRIWIAFPDSADRKRNWYLVPHDLMVAHGQAKFGHTKSWAKGIYHRPAPSAGWQKEYSDYRIDVLLAKSGAELIHADTDLARNWLTSRK
jgi:hypothetical protein